MINNQINIDIKLFLINMILNIKAFWWFDALNIRRNKN